MKRRTFIVASAASLAVPMVGCEPKKKPGDTDSDTGQTVAKAPPPHKFEFFGPAEVVTLNAALDRFFPEDDPTGAPSHLEARVGPYIDGQLLRPDFRGLRRMMQGGMEFLQAVSVRRFEGTFDSRPPEVRDDILRQFQTGQVSGLKFPQARWFATFHTFALEGYWGDPKYGGNFDERVWEWADINPHCAHIHLSCGK